MANFVIKKDGSKESFDASKIEKAVRTASAEAGIAEERVSEIAKQVLDAVAQIAANKEEIATSEIKDKVLSELDTLEPAVSGAWRKHDQEKANV